MKRMNILIILTSMLISSFIIRAGETYPAAAIWELTDPDLGGTGYTVATVGYVSSGDMKFIGTEKNGYTGPESSIRIRIIGNEWPANQTTRIEDVCVEFKIAPNANSLFFLDSLTFKIGATAINTMKAEIYYSTDPDFTTSAIIPFSTGQNNNYIVRDVLTSFKLAVSDTIYDGDTLYVRFYPWVEDPTVRTGKYVCLQDVQIIGRIETLSTPASIIWFAQGEETPVITGSLLADNSVYSDSLELYDQTTDLPVNGTDDTVTCGAIHTTSKSWNAETDTVSYLYFSFNVTPKSGGTLHLDSLTMNIGGWFESQFKAAVYYSTNIDFSDATLLIVDASLPGNSVDTWRASLDTIIQTGEAFYLRIYPYNTHAVGWAKLVAINNVTLYGYTTGVTADPPQVETAGLSYLSTTFVTCGGSILNDGGSIVTERGVVWNTSSLPTTDDNKTSDGTGSGSFISYVSGLLPNTSYYIRAYATNKAGTSYGAVDTFTTLATVVTPVVSTTEVSTILVTTAKSGGNVTDWGGAEVTAKGVCWNTAGSPTINDSFTENGTDLGTFISTLHPLQAVTKYYVRAYATNTAGTAYGNELSFTTQAPAADIVKYVAKDGSGDYTTVQAAFDEVPELYTGTYTIFVKPGEYKEKLMLSKNKVNVILKASHPDSSILVYDDNANSSNGSGGTLGTSGSQSVAIDADDFTAINITFQNTNTVAQAVALRAAGDRQSYYHCKLRGYQDTYYTYGLGRIYMKQCYLEGAVDYIFGKSTVIFDSCELKELRNGGPYTAASTDVNSNFGYVFKDCKLMTDAVGYDGNAITGVYLGRPWQARPQVVYMNCEEPSTLAPAGWTNMSSGLNPLFAEYNCFGPGYKPDQRSTDPNYTGLQLTDEQASQYTIPNIFSKKTNPSFGIDWMPDTFGMKLSQEITFSALETKNLSDVSFNLEATASSNLDVSYASSNSDVATVTGNTVSIVGIGTTEITASQAGNFLYKAAGDVKQTLTIEAEDNITNITEGKISFFPNPVKNTICIVAHGYIGQSVEIFNLEGQKVKEHLINSDNIDIDITSFAKGVYVVKINSQVFRVVKM